MAKLLAKVEEKKDSRKKSTDTEILSLQFKKVFSTPDGKEVLIHILNMLGYFTIDVNNISIDNIAVANMIVLAIGATHEDNILDFASSLVNCKTIKENEDE